MQIEINKVYNMDCIENMRKWTENKGICVEICNTNKVIGNIYDNPEILED